MLFRNKIFSGLGSSLEWFDFALYGFLGPIFSEVFFSKAQQAEWLSLIITYTVFAIGFAARPLGALIFGYIGDKFGRKISLRITPLLITLVTVSIAFLPSYQSVGTLAVFLLLGTRIIQGILIGGEFAGNIVYLCESSVSWKYFFGSIGSCCGSFGMILASTIASIFYSLSSDAFMYSYGWRIAFLLSIPLGLISFIMRLYLPESPEFIQTEKIANPIIHSFKHQKQKMLSCTGLVCLHATSFYFVFMFFPVFFSKIRHIPESASMIHNTGFLIIHLCFIPLFGALVSYVGGLRSLKFISIVFVITTLPLFSVIAYASQWYVFIALFIFSILTAFNAAVIPGLLNEILPTNIRYTILAFTFNLTFGLFGGIIPMLSLLFINKTGVKISPAIYVTCIALITLITGLKLSKEKQYEAR